MAALQPLDQFRAMKSDVSQHIGHRVPLDERLDLHVPLFGQVHVHGIGVAKQIVQVAQDFLIGADQERAQHVGRVVERMKQHSPFDVASIDELVDLAIRVARDVGQHGGPCGTFVEPMDRQDREQLVDGPAVRQRLEHGEVAEISVAEQAVQLRQFFRNVFHLADHAADLSGRWSRTGSRR